jgi:catalase-peroxidase
MGPLSRYLGAEVPKEVLIWQDPLPAVDHELVNDQDIAQLKAKLLDSGLTTASVAVSADTSYGTLSITATGIAATTIVWLAEIENLELDV